jgi:hypothetical protein
VGCTAIHALAADEGVAGRSGHCSRVVRVSIVKIVVVDHRGVADDGVVNIDVVNIAETGVIPGMERFAEA